MPYMLIVILASPVWLPVVGWVYLRLTTRDKITARLHAMGLPASGLELERWRQPENDGRAEFREALHLMRALKLKIGDKEYSRILKLNTDEYAENREALEGFFADLKPIRQKMSEAAKHDAITYGTGYRNEYKYINNSPDEYSAILRDYRDYVRASVCNALFAFYEHNDTTIALAILSSVVDTDYRIKLFATHEVFNSLSIHDNDLLPATEGVIFHPDNSPEELRGFAATLIRAGDNLYDRSNLADCVAGEIAVVQDMFADLANNGCGNVHAYIPRSVPIPPEFFSILLRDVDNLRMLDKLLRWYSILDGSYPKMKDAIEAICQEPVPEIPDDGRLFCEWNMFLVSGAMYYPYDQSVCAEIKRYFSVIAGLLQAGIACELAADRLEGRDWPENLDDSRWPRDPFTDQPFQLIFTDDSLLICSTGPDQAHSGKAEIFNRTGRMEHSTEVPAVASEDDIIFRIPRAIYETPAAAATPADARINPAAPASIAPVAAPADAAPGGE